MASFDSMYFENNRCHVLANLKAAEKNLNDCDLEGVKIALDCEYAIAFDRFNEII